MDNTIKMNLSDYTKNIVIDKDILGGTPVFTGTRVPIKNLFDYLATGETLDTL